MLAKEPEVVETAVRFILKTSRHTVIMAFDTEDEAIAHVTKMRERHGQNTPTMTLVHQTINVSERSWNV